MTMRNIPLAERRAEARDLDARLKEHRKACYTCRSRNPCDVAADLAADLAAELAEARQDIRTWFDPGPDQGELTTL